MCSGFKECVLLPDFVQSHSQSMIVTALTNANAPAVVQVIKKSKKRKNEALRNVTTLLAQSPIRPVNIHSRRFFLLLI